MPFHRPLISAVLTAVLAACLAPPAQAASLLSLFYPKPRPVQKELEEKMHAPIVRSPDAPVGTILLVHGGGWAGPDRYKQEYLMGFPGPVFADRGWRVLSIDYERGLAGLQAVKDAIGAELVEAGREGPLCVYGESAGAHLAMIAAAQIPSVDCLVAVGGPVDFSTFRAQAQAEGNETAVGTYDETIVGRLGDAAALGPEWQPVAVAAQINADVLAVRQADDQVVPKGQLGQLVEALPVMDTLVTGAGDLNDPAQKYLHGSLDAEAREQMAGALGAFADRAVANDQVKAWGRAQRCADANSALSRIGAVAFRRSVACLVNRVRAEENVDERVRSAARLRSGSRTTARVVGQVTPARVVAAVAQSRTRRAVLLREAKALGVAVRLADKSAVTLTLR